MEKNQKNIAKKDRKYVNILGINIISNTKEEVLTRVNNYLSHNVKFYIVTPNPELVLMSQGNPELKKALNEAQIIIADGVGLSYASKFLYGKGVNIIHGRNLFMDLMGYMNRKKGKVFLLGGKDNEAEAAANKLKRKYEDIKISWMRGPILYKNASPATEVNEKIEKDTVDKINKFAPDMLFVAYGNPKQEIWLNKNYKSLKIGGGMAVGGTFRYISGMSKLPPKWMETLELEWLWRLFTEPERIGRIFNAVLVFSWRVLLKKLSS